MHHIRRSAYLLCGGAAHILSLSSVAYHQVHHASLGASDMLTNNHWSAHFFHGITFQYQEFTFQDISRRMSSCNQHSIGTVQCNAMQQCIEEESEDTMCTCCNVILWARALHLGRNTKKTNRSFRRSR